ncbi:MULTISPECIES: hypothetical protein [Clostridium]|uniref:Replication initiator protein A (RepA) N-terminus n=1 Tax=Clostridium frigoriphilum TaxID=443253 RepID=A0ABU7UUH8_9CLOT|nr:hypothetical protein [Clostridium sp. DSM 17811]MBU3098724.1 hypothetical protein [Clostridium sp. DSM 17811]
MVKNTEIKNTTLKDLFMDDKGGFIPVTRKFSRVLGFNCTGLLEELCDRYDFYKAQDELNEYGEFFYTVPSMEINTGLTKREQITAIKKLREYGFIEYTTTRSMPRIRYFKMSNSIPKILKHLCAQAESKRKEIQEQNIKDKTKLNKTKSVLKPLDNAVGTM